MGVLTDTAAAAEQTMTDTAAAAQDAADAAHAAAGAAIAAAEQAASTPEPEPVIEQFPAHDHPHEHEGYARREEMDAYGQRLAAMEGALSAHLAEAQKPVEAEVAPPVQPAPEPERAPEGSKKRRLFGGLG